MLKTQRYGQSVNWLCGAVFLCREKLNAILIKTGNQIVDLEVTGSRPVTRPILSRGWLNTPRALILAHGPEGLRNGAGKALCERPLVVFSG